jgi:hypothetical protein
VAPKGDGTAFLLIMLRDEDGWTMLLEERGDLHIGQRATEFGGVIVDFGLKIGRELGGDVFALLFRQPEFYGSEVSIEQVHVGDWLGLFCWQHKSVRLSRFVCLNDAVE